MFNPKLNILAIDDNNEWLLLLKQFFQKSQSNFKIQTIVKTENILSEIRNFNPDIIICDYKMPGITGIEVNTLLKDYNYHIPFILCTAEKGLQDLAYKHKIDVLIEKTSPIEITLRELCNFLKSFVQNR